MSLRRVGVRRLWPNFPREIQASNKPSPVQPKLPTGWFLVALEESYLLAWIYRGQFGFRYEIYIQSTGRACEVEPWWIFYLLSLAPVHFRFLTFLARDLRGLAGIKVYFSFVYVSNTLGSSSEHNCEVCQTIKNEINETVKELKSESANRNWKLKQ